MENNNIYIKKGKKYIPVGIRGIQDEYLMDGLYLVRHEPGCRKIDNVNWLSGIYGLIRLTDSNINFTDLSKICTFKDLEETITNALSEAYNKVDDNGYHMSIAELSQFIVKEINKKYKI